MRVAGWLLVLAGMVAGPGGVQAAVGAVADTVSRFPLQVTGTQLLDAQGREFRMVGDAAWMLLVSLTVNEADRYLAARQAAGFNTILVELIERQRAGPSNRNGDRPFPEGRPFTAPSAAYFRHAQAVLDLALKHDFLVLLAPAYLGYGCGRNGWCNQMLATPDATLEAYGKFVATQLADYPNLVWVHGGDVDAEAHQVLGKVEAVYRGINVVLPDALHTAHCSRQRSAVDCYDLPWLDLNTTYSECGQTASRTRLDHSRVKTMPSFYIEGGYEEEKSTPLCIRSQIWWTYLGGSVGHVFGNKRIWQFDPDWRDALDTPGTQAMSVASQLLARLRNDVPLQPYATTDSPLAINDWASAWARLGFSRSSVALAWTSVAGHADAISVASSGTTTIAYLPYATSFQFLGNRTIRCWIDPRTGAKIPITAGATTFRSPDAQDWLFVAEKSRQLCS